jgi:hypothetical protein
MGCLFSGLGLFWYKGLEKYEDYSYSFGAKKRIKMRCRFFQPLFIYLFIYLFFLCGEGGMFGSSITFKIFITTNSFLLVVEISFHMP